MAESATITMPAAVAIDNVTADITTGPYEVNPDVDFGTTTQLMQFLNSTFIGPDIDFNNGTDDIIDNCHFFGTGGAVSAQIGTLGVDKISVTRCTDQSLVNNITSPGGNVEYDNSDRLMVDELGSDAYVGNNTTSDIYLTIEADNGLNGGEQILFEPATLANGYVYTQCVAVYQNTLSGDGAESFLDNGSGVLVEGQNIIVDDNDISNVTQGIHIWQAGNVATDSQFGLFTNNSIHNVDEGIYLQLSSNSGITNAPWMMCNSFSGNTINGIRDFPFNYALYPAAFYIDYSMQSTTPPQVLMNVFNGNTVTNAAFGLVLFDTNGFNDSTEVPLGATIFSNNFFDSSGDVSLATGNIGSTEIWEQYDSQSNLFQSDDIWEAFWFEDVTSP